MGHIKRSRDPADERQVRVNLTPEGRTLRQKALSIPHCILNASGLGVEGVQRLRSAIAALRDALESYNPA